MIDAMHVDYDFQFQQPIFFYPSLQKTWWSNWCNIIFREKTIDNEECYHIMATNNDWMYTSITRPIYCQTFCNFIGKSIKLCNLSPPCNWVQILKFHAVFDFYHQRHNYKYYEKS
jgi:hypothetical protein